MVRHVNATTCILFEYFFFPVFKVLSFVQQDGENTCITKHVLSLTDIQCHLDSILLKLAWINFFQLLIILIISQNIYLPLCPSWGTGLFSNLTSNGPCNTAAKLSPDMILIKSYYNEEIRLDLLHWEIFTDNSWI